MKRLRIVSFLALILLTLLCAQALADIPPIGYTKTPEPAVYGLATSNIAMNDGPGTRRYFNELGTYRVSGSYLKIVAKAWDPNNGIWWLKVECPRGTGHYGWTGLKRFDANSFDLDKVPMEIWYNY